MDWPVAGVLAQAVPRNRESDGAGGRHPTMMSCTPPVRRCRQDPAIVVVLSDSGGGLGGGGMRPAPGDPRGAPGRATTAPAGGRVDQSGAPPKARPPRGRYGHAHHQRVRVAHGLRRAERAVAAEGPRPPRPALPALHRPLAVLRAQHRRRRRPGRGLSPRRRPRVRRGGGRADPADSRPPREQPHRLVEERRRPAARRAPVPRAGHERDAAGERHGGDSSPTPTCWSPCR